MKNGTNLWRVIPGTGDSFSCSPVVVNGTVYTATSKGNLLGYSAKSGTHAFAMNLGEAIYGSEYFVVPQAGMGAG